MLTFLAQATATATPAGSGGFDTRPYLDAVDAWKGLSFGMALLFVLLIALGVIALIVFYIARPRSQSTYNAHETMRQEMIKIIADERKEKEAVEEEKRRLEALFAEGLSALSDANNRIADNGKRQNDLIEAINQRGKERDETQAQLASAISEIVEKGSKPLQQVAVEVKAILDKVTSVNTRSETWEEIVLSLPQFRSELTALIDLLQHEAEKRATQTVQAVMLPAQPEGLVT